MRPIALLACLAAGCAPRATVDIHAPIPRSETIVVERPVESFALDPDVLQREVAKALKASGFSRVELRGEGRYRAAPRSELMARPLEDDGDFVTGPWTSRRSYVGERVRADLEIRDPRGGTLYHAVLVEGLSSSLTEARVAGALVRPLSE